MEKHGTCWNKVSEAVPGRSGPQCRERSVLYKLYCTIFTGPYSRFDVTAARLVYRTMVKKVFKDFDSLILLNILRLFYTPIWLSRHGSENQE